MMAEVVRWFKSGEVKLTKFSQLKVHSDDTEDGSLDGKDQETGSNVRGSVRGRNEGKPQYIVL